jgi:glycosyltransferase involved in cell wall biosynthesis
MVVGSLGYSLANFRLDLMRRMVELGHDVIAVAPDFDAQTISTLADCGIRTRTVPMERTGTRPIKDLRTLAKLARLFREESPDIVVPYTMKPIVYGSLAARIAGVPECYPLFTGLGYLFAGELDARRRLLRTIAVGLHRVGLRKVSGAFCYNDAEVRDIRSFGLLPSDVALVKVPGSGVDTRRFTPTPMPPGPVRFLFVGRLLRSKGLEVLATAVKRLRMQGHDVTVDLLGPHDTNPDAIDHATLAAWTEEGLFRQLGSVRDVRPIFAQSHVLVLPTMLREGIPRTILEAMACGRPVITTDAPGCGETITDGVSGRIVPQNDPDALAEAMSLFITAPERIVEMGNAARAEVCRNNDVRHVNSLLLTEIGVEPRVVQHPREFPQRINADAPGSAA